MGGTEDIIKYQLDFSCSEPTTENLQELNCWRSILFNLGLIGQDVSRYEGYGFGNLSQRSRQHKSTFIISGSQTGHLDELTPNHYVCVESCDIAGNHVVASGPLKPSSEALTHAMFYQLDSSIKCVLHIHSPKLWQFGLNHHYPVTEQSVEYGTREMAIEVSLLYHQGSLQQYQTLIMKGHEDGVIFYGDSINQAALAFLRFWVHANKS